jgi:hypothetical protein
MAKKPCQKAWNNKFLKLAISILLCFISIGNSIAQPKTYRVPAYFEKTTIIENGKAIDPKRLTIEIRYADFRVDSVRQKIMRFPVTWKVEHPVHNDTLLLQKIQGLHSYLLRKDGFETKIYFPTNNISYHDASIHDLKNDLNTAHLFRGKISDPMTYSTNEVAILNAVKIIEWNELVQYDAELHDKTPRVKATITAQQLSSTSLKHNSLNTVQKPDSVIQLLFRNSKNELLQHCKVSLLLEEGKVVPLDLISCYNYCRYLIPTDYRKRTERYQRIIVFHEDYQTDTFQINIGNHQYYLFQNGEPWICIGNKIPFRKPKSEYMLAVPSNSSISFDSLARFYNLSIDSLLVEDPFDGDGLRRAYCSFNSNIDSFTQRKALNNINQNGRIIYPLCITYSESYEHIVGFGNEVWVSFENNVSKDDVLELLAECGLKSPVVGYYQELYQTAQANIPDEWDLEKLQRTLNNLHLKKVFLLVGIYFLE